MANVAGQTTLNGDLSRYGGLIFVKGGKLTIDSDMATNYEGSKWQWIYVEKDATLLLKPHSMFTLVEVRNGGLLSGDATISHADVMRGGHISPGDGGIGKLTITGNLYLYSGSFYDVDIAADGRSDTLGMRDSAYIDKNVKVLVNTLDPHTSYQNGQTYRILTAGGGVNGMFSEAVLDSAFLEASLTRDRKTVDLTIRQKETGGGDDGHSGGGDDGHTGGGDGGHSGGGDDGHTGGGDDGHTGGGDDGHTGGGDDGDSGGKPEAPGIFQTVATSDNQWNTAGALSSLAQQGPSLGLYNALLMLNAAQARDAFNQLSGEQYASVQASLQQSGTLVGSVVNQHMQTMFDGDSLTVPPLAMSLVQSPERERNGAWGQMFGSWTRSKGDGNVGKLDSNTGGFLVGADRELSDGVRAGAYAGYSRTRFDVDSRSSSGHSNNYHLGLYGAGQRDALALRGGVGYSWHRIESERNVGFGGYRDRLTGDYDGNTLQAFTELGYRLRYEAASVEPFVNLSYVRLHTDAVQEQGGAAALSVKDETMNTFYSTLGLRGATDISVSGVDVTLHGKLGWQHAYGDTDTSARMAFASGDSFTSKGAPVDKDVAVVGVGLDVPLTRSTRVGVSYQGQYGSQQQANSVNAQLTVSF
ncbi:Extracellular serine protease precursor [Serratia rubidaea]|uniref:Extracellular serine protease n=1 Tax=Serratia rubidaea TaxID=61652 RepID=A0A447QDX8_SERRU|nr:Extracellular serine protease precursor [Serratia rubidaea]